MVETKPLPAQNGSPIDAQIFDDPEFMEHVRTIGSASVCADYYLHTYKQPLRHCEASELAQRAYTAADAFLAARGVTINTTRQQIIHLAESLLS